MTDFLFTLECDLPQVSPSSLESVFNQCMYFGLSFGRIGADFRVLLVPIFSRVVLDRFDQSLLAAQTQFSDSMSKFCVQTQATSASSASAHSVTNTGDQVCYTSPTTAKYHKESLIIFETIESRFNHRSSWRNSGHWPNSATPLSPLSTIFAAAPPST